MMYDFYFSKKHLDHRKQDEIREKINYVHHYFNGQEYTEMVEHGKKPLTQFLGDLILIGTGEEPDKK